MSVESTPLEVRNEYTPVNSPFMQVILEQVAEVCGGTYAELPTTTAEEAEEAARLAAENERIEGDPTEFWRCAALCPPLTPEDRYPEISIGLGGGVLRVAKLTVPTSVTRDDLNSVACSLLRQACQEFGEVDRRGFLEDVGVLEKETF